jgi:hypothetical protein
MSAGAVRWSCARCGVSVGRIDGEPTDLPETWTAAERETFCLTCSRARAGEVALALTEGESSREDRVRIQRDAVIEFEIDRTPEAPNRAIANACHTSSSAVAAVRDLMESTSASPDPDRGAASAV